jgi:hypothetical protein
MFDNDEDYELQREAKEVARKTMQMDDWERYVEGAAFKILKLEREVQRLKFNIYLGAFLLFGLPVILAVLGLR